MTKRVTVDGVSSNVVVSFCAFSLAQVSDLHRLNKIIPQESWLGEGALCKAAQQQWLCLIQTNLILSPLSNADFIIIWSPTMKLPLFMFVSFSMLKCLRDQIYGRGENETLSNRDGRYPSTVLQTDSASRIPAITRYPTA